MVATGAEELATIESEIIPKAERNGVVLQRLAREEILEAAPYVSPRIIGGVLVEGEGVIDPFWTTRAYCENAVSNGAQVFLGEPVTGINVADECIYVYTGGGLALAASMVVNAAGLWADEVARMVGDDSFTLTPRRGQFIVIEEDHGVSQIILPVPNRISKGILVTPIVFGGVLLGPTAEEVDAKTDLATTSQGMHQIREGIGKLVPVMAQAESVRQFAGLRAVSSTGDYVIRASTVSSRILHVAGIRSTGLSASPAIGRYVSGLVRDELRLPLRNHFMDELPEYLTGMHPDEGDVVCLCRSITRGEILSALRSPLPPATLDSLKRRTGVMLGDCQGNLCMSRLIDLFQEQLGRDPLTLAKNVVGSCPIAGRLPGAGFLLKGQESLGLDGRDRDE
jgi:glycerol-3-phosphate dehydrogenase